MVCFMLIVLVLLQPGKEGMGVIFGGGSSSLFGSGGAGGVLVKLTTFVAIIFLVTSLGYNVLSSTKVQDDSAVLKLMQSDPSAPVTAPTNQDNSAMPPRTDAPNAPVAPAAPVAPSADRAPAAPRTPSEPAAPVVPSSQDPVAPVAPTTPNFATPPATAPAN